ncbi:hypothetical protein [Litorimonas taeanensis]|uniref:hypothetical protein n=1 Tax=Litorimonas taeanensis TaxID=568099 RepID=UPI000EB1E287|nr:hypothetical protein [Litorimonas taeanensis]
MKLYRWIDKLGSIYVKGIKSQPESPSPIWYLDEVYTTIISKLAYLNKVVDDVGTINDDEGRKKNRSEWS